MPTEIKWVFEPVNLENRVIIDEEILPHESLGRIYFDDENLARIRRLGFIAALNNPSSDLKFAIYPIRLNGSAPMPYRDGEPYIRTLNCKFWLYPVEATISGIFLRRKHDPNVNFVEALYSNLQINQNRDEINLLSCWVVDIDNVRYAIYNDVPPIE